MNLTEWARAQGVYPQTAYRWFREGTLPVPAVRVNQRTVLVSPDAPTEPAAAAYGHVQEIGWNEHWTCTGCGTSHQRDDNAAINLARYEPITTDDSALGPVRAAVKRGADRKTRPRRADGDETRKGPSQQAGNNPETGCWWVAHYDSLIGNGTWRTEAGRL